MAMTTTSLVSRAKRIVTSEAFFTPLILMIVSLIVFRGQLSGVSFATHPDNTYMYLPLLAHASRVFSSGEYPYWINSIVGGIPLFDTPQFTVDYPFYFLWAGVYTSALAVITVVQYITLLHYFILLLNSYVLFRALRLSIVAAFAGATMFAFSANMVSYFFSVTMLAPYSWLPLFIASVAIAIRRDEFFKPFFMGVFSIVMTVLSAPSLPFIHCCFISAVLIGFFLVTAIIRREYSRVRSALSVLSATAIASFLIVCPYLLSELQSMPGFIRWIGESSLIGDVRIPFKAFLLGQMSYIHLLDPIFPYEGGHLIGNAFIGWGGCFLFLLSLNRIKESPILIPFLFLALWGFLSSFGSNLGFAYINYNIPFLNLMREPGRHLFIFIFSSSVLIAHGVDYLVSNRNKGREFFLTKYNVASFFLLALLFVVAPFVFKIAVERDYVVLTILTIGALLGYLFLSSGRIRLGLVAVLSMLMVSTTLNYFYFIRIPLAEGDYFNRWNLVSHEVLKELSKTESIERYRVIFQEPKRDQFWSMNGSYYGIRSFNAYFNPLPYEQFYQLFYQGHQYDNYRELLGTKYIVCNECDGRSLKNFSLERESYGYKIYKSEKAFPRYKVVHELESVYESAPQFYERLGTGYDYLTRLQIEKKSRDFLKDFLGAKSVDSVGTCTLKEESSTANTLVLSASCEQPGVLVFNEFFSPNWRITVNNKVKELFRVNLNQIGVPISKGPSFIEIEYRPQLFYWLRMLSKLVVSGLLLIFVFCLQATARARPLTKKSSVPD